jgi:hypothetical protein
VTARAAPVTSTLDVRETNVVSDRAARERSTI